MSTVLNYYVLTPTSIVFISGIGSHAYGSWASKLDPWLMWPRHFLPKHLPTARVMAYGHRADIRGTGFGDLLDYSRNFSDSLKQARKGVSCLRYKFQLIQVLIFP